uniref:(northern house mosquito) hypothetical protein n=1 Tax=Culex pipiens TaxID=7175 RepID=A0A8D8APJ5_CULPI
MTSTCTKCRLRGQLHGSELPAGAEANVNLPMYTLPEEFLGATRLSQQLSIIPSFLIMFHYLYMDALKPQSLLGQAIFGTVIGYLIYAGDASDLTPSWRTLKRPLPC